jgi:photosystem II stability/assembly factor-like uncharacterized protein
VDKRTRGWFWPIAAVSVALIALMAMPADAQTQRVRGSITPSALPVTLKAVSCTSPQICIAVGGQGVTVPLASIAARTTDGGAKWASTLFGAGNAQPSALACPTARRCIAVGGRTAGASTTGAAVRSEDGGRNWTVISNLPRGVGQLASISCPTLGFCMAVGSAVDQSFGVAVVSTRFGRHWKVVALPPGEKSLGLVTCSAQTHCIAVGGGPSGFATTIITTSNGGRTWETASVPSAITSQGIPGASGISCPGVAQCFIVGDSVVPDGGPSGYIWTSADGGAHWSTETLPLDTNFLNAISCVTTAHCVVVGGGVLPRGGVVRSILTTSNGGQTWVSQVVPTLAAGLSGVSCSTADECTAVGGGFASASPSAALTPVVMVTHDGGVTWVTAS